MTHPIAALTAIGSASSGAARAGPGLVLARGGPGRPLNVYLLGTVVLDAGVRWSRRLGAVGEWTTSVDRIYRRTL
jgi:hypothetical protein